MQQKKKNDRSANRFVSVPNLSALESSGVGNGHANRLDPIPNSSIHDIEFNSSRPLPQPIPPKEPKMVLRWAEPHQFLIIFFPNLENKNWFLFSWPPPTYPLGLRILEYGYYFRIIIFALYFKPLYSIPFYCKACWNMIPPISLISLKISKCYIITNVLCAFTFINNCVKCLFLPALREYVTIPQIKMIFCNSASNKIFTILDLYWFSSPQKKYFSINKLWVYVNIVCACITYHLMLCFSIKISSSTLHYNCNMFYYLTEILYNAWHPEKVNVSLFCFNAIYKAGAEKRIGSLHYNILFLNLT